MKTPKKLPQPVQEKEIKSPFPILPNGQPDYDKIPTTNVIQLNVEKKWIEDALKKIKKQGHLQVKTVYGEMVVIRVWPQV